MLHLVDGGYFAEKSNMQNSSINTIIGAVWKYRGEWKTS